MDYDAIRRAEAEHRAKHKISPKTWIKGIAIAIASVMVGLWVIGLIIDAVVVNISEETEEEWFAGLDIGATNAPQDVSQSFGLARSVFNKLKTSGELRPLNFRLRYVPMDGPNAFAVPGGQIGVTGPLLKNVQSEIGLAMVLAHELGHQQHRHSLKRIGRQIVLGILAALVFQNDMGSLAGKALDLASLSHSRDQEREADRFGLQLVHETFGTTEGALEFFEFVQREHAGDESLWSSLLQTHPMTTERLEYLREMQRELEE